MLHIKEANTVPPGGWRYYCEDTKTWLTSGNFNGLVGVVRGHLTANSLAVPEPLEYHIEEKLCKLLPPDKCLRDDKPQPVLYKRLSLAQILAGTKTLGEWFLKGKKVVDQQTADNRARTCYNCIYNVKPVAGCTACADTQLRNAAQLIVGNRKTKHDYYLHACTVCGCTLKASVWLPLDIQQKHIPKDVNKNLPDYCWKKRHEPRDVQPDQPEGTK